MTALPDPTNIREHAQGDSIGATLTTNVFCSSGTNPHLILITEPSTADPVPVIGPAGAILLAACLAVTAGGLALSRRRGV